MLTFIVVNNICSKNRKFHILSHREQEVSQTKNNNNRSEHQEREIRQESNLTNQYEETPSG